MSSKFWAISSYTFNDNNTYIVGNYISNGCTVFHVKDIDKVCKDHVVPDHIKQEVLSIISTFSYTTQDLIDVFLKEYDCYDYKLDNIYEMFINQGVCEDDRVLDLLIQSNSTTILSILVKNDIAIDRISKLENLSEIVIWHLIDKGLYLDRFIDSNSSFVRCKVARQGYGLETLVNDVSSAVRAEVAEQGYGLDILVNDPSSMVRQVVAYQGYGLEILVNDCVSSVRRMALWRMEVVKA